MGEIFNDDTVASAIPDRLLHHNYPFLINVKSFRLKSMIKYDELKLTPAISFTWNIGQISD